MIGLIVLGVVVIVLMMIAGIYNTFVKANNMVINANAGIDTYLKKRFDLIPNLIAAVKKYTNHEASTLEKVTALRSKMSDATTISEKAALDSQVTGMLKGFMVNVEAYPDLKASEQFTRLQASMNEVEEQLSAARRAYNAAVNAYNNIIQTFPNVMFANMFGYVKKDSFEVNEIERENINAEDLLN